MSGDESGSNAGVIGGVIGGIAFCLIFATISWWMLRRRRQRMTVQPQHRDLLLEDALHEKVSQQPYFDQSALEKGHEWRPSGSRFNKVVLSFASSKDSGSPPSPVDPFANPQPHVPSLPPLDPPPQIHVHPSKIKRSNSTKSLDSESLYSASSAPRSDAYEATYQPRTLASIPGSPTASSFPIPPPGAGPRRGPMHLVNQPELEPAAGSTVTAMREALAPETYAAGHRRLPSEPSTQGPFLTPMSAQPGANRSKSKRRSRSEIISSFRNSPLPPTPESSSSPNGRRPYLAPIVIPGSSPRPLPVPGSRP